MESHKRSIAKAVTYRIMGFAMTTAVVYVITKRADLAGGIGLADTVVKLGGYYVHERLWGRFHWGRKPPQNDYQI